MSAVEKLCVELETGAESLSNSDVACALAKMLGQRLRAAIKADPEQPSVDWLDPARESCLIDGVRYRREQKCGGYREGYSKGLEDAGVVKSDIKRWLTGPHAEAEADLEGPEAKWRESEFSAFVAEIEFALETIWIDQPEKAERASRLIRGAIVGSLRIPDSTEGAVPEGYEERWAVNTGGQEYAHYRNEEDAQHDVELIYGDRSEAFRILVPASPEPDKETP